MADQWRDIETAPQDGTIFDVWAVRAEDGKGGSRITNCRYARTLNGLQLCGTQNIISSWLRPTHWRRIPEPPG